MPDETLHSCGAGVDVERAGNEVDDEDGGIDDEDKGIDDEDGGLDDALDKHEDDSGDTDDGEAEEHLLGDIEASEERGSNSLRTS